MERPLKLLEINIKEPHDAWLSASQQQCSIVIKHGPHKLKNLFTVDLFCRIWNAIIPTPLQGDLPTSNIYAYPTNPPVNENDWRNKITGIFDLNPYPEPAFGNQCKQELWRDKYISLEEEGIYKFSFDILDQNFTAINAKIKSEAIAVDLGISKFENTQQNQCRVEPPYIIDRINLFPLGRPGEESRIWIQAIAPYKTI